MVKSEPEDSVYKEDIKEEKSAKSPRDLIWECFQKVTEEKNIGHWLDETFRDRSRMKNAIGRVAMDRGGDFRPVLSLAPTTTMNDFWLSLDQLDYSMDAKHGSSLP
ncbi:unnamed protein product [Durusdinium trenchii]|uniref:Uncharacterized protein n=1 Tax=Durusdinium trenchii TaxID=1381693 RepID=A0ABP0N3D0_9DINO